MTMRARRGSAKNVRHRCAPINAAHREDQAAKKKADREQNPEKIKAQKAASYQRNKEHVKTHRKDYYQENKEEILAKAKQVRDANPEEYKAKHRERYHRDKDKHRESRKEKHKATYRQKTYGLSNEQFAKMQHDQGDRCPICKMPFNPEIRECEPCLDHDHATGKVRGAICRVCNTAMGQLGDDPRVLEAAARYLERFRKAVAS
jgi:Recombination endonuclease VII